MANKYYSAVIYAVITPSIHSTHWEEMDSTKVMAIQLGAIPCDWIVKSE